MNAHKAFGWIVVGMLVAASAACLLQSAPAAENTPAPTEAPATVEPTLPAATAEPTEAASPEATADNGEPATAEATQEPTAEATMPADAERIQFSAGATAATLDGSLDPGATDAYVLQIDAGQLIDVTVTSDPSAQLVITGADGTPLKNTMSEGSFFRGVVPATQDYLIEVSTGDEALTYTLNVLIPERITFEEGGTAAVVEGNLDTNGSHAYVLNLQADQLLEVSVSPPDELQLVIYGQDGTVIRSGMGQGAFFRGTVPTGQDYIMQISTSGDAMPYTMNVLVPERISFEAGTSFAEVSGSAKAFDSHAYVVHVLADQTMQLTVSANSDVQTTIYGVDGTVLKSGMGGGPDFNGSLPSDQDYIIMVRAAEQPIEYIMSLTIE